MSDMLFSLPALIFLIPVYLLISFLQLVFNKGDVFFVQQRIGYQNQSFNIVKFTTMKPGSALRGPGMITLLNDSRKTRLGKFLRFFKLDELPQLLLVLTGKMSLVGPRPLPEEIFSQYSDEVKSKIYTVRPGITGMGSLVFRNEEQYLFDHAENPKRYYEEIIAPAKGDVELWYLNHRSLSTDFRILFLTGWYIVFPKSNLLYKVFHNLPSGIN
ncbi:MAG: sugar transferase [Bacteroidia bacterium]